MLQEALTGMSFETRRRAFIEAINTMQGDIESTISTKSDTPDLNFTGALVRTQVGHAVGGFEKLGFALPAPMVLMTMHVDRDNTYRKLTYKAQDNSLRWENLGEEDMNDLHDSNPSLQLNNDDRFLSSSSEPILPPKDWIILGPVVLRELKKVPLNLKPAKQVSR